MKRTLALLLAAIMVLGLAACGDSSAASASTASTAETGAAEASGEVKIKDTIIFAQPADVTSLDPQVGKQLRACTVLTNMFECLVKLDENYEVVPSLAEGWNWVTDTRVEFTIRQNVKFHNGETMTIEDVVYSLERAVNSKYVGYYFTFIDSIEKVSDTVVAVNLKNPYGATMLTLANPTAAIVCKSVAEQDEEGFTNNPVGTGPYKFVSRVQSESVTMEKFDEYWGTPAVTQYAVMKVVPESTQREIMLETGEIDLAYEFAPSDVAKVEAIDNLTMYTADSTKVVLVEINQRKDADEPLADVRVREAIRCAINKDLIVEKVVYGHGGACATLASPQVFGFPEKLPTNDYNPERAKQLLAEAGYENGFSMTIWTYTEQIYQEVAQVIQQMLAEVGIESTIEPMEYSTLSARMAGGENYDISIDYFNSTTGDAGHTIQSQFNSQSGDNSNWCRVNNPEIDALIAQLRGSNDDAVRLEAADQLWDIIYNDVIEFGLYYENVLVGASVNVKDFRVTRDGFHDLKHAYVVVE